MPARSLPKTFDDPPEPDDNRVLACGPASSTEFADRSARIDAFRRRIDAFRDSSHRSTVQLGMPLRLGMPVPADDLREFDATLHLLLSGGDGTCGEVWPESGPGSPDQPTAA